MTTQKEDAEFARMRKAAARSSEEDKRMWALAQMAMQEGDAELEEKENNRKKAIALIQNWDWLEQYDRVVEDLKERFQHKQ